MASKNIFIVVFAILALSKFSEVTARTASRVKRSNCLVTAAYNPVCGTDGQTYTNPSTLKCDQEDNPYLEIAYEGACQEGESGDSRAFNKQDLDSENLAVARRQTSNEGDDDNGLESLESEPQQQTYDDEEFYPSDSTM